MGELDQKVLGHQVVLDEIQRTMNEESSLVDAQFVTKKDRFQQLVGECGRKFNAQDLQIASLIQNVEGLTQTAMNQGMVVPSNASDKFPHLYLQLLEKVFKLGWRSWSLRFKLEGLEKNFESLDSAFDRF